MDVTGARAIRILHEMLQDRGVDLRLVEPHAPLRDMLRAEGVDTTVSGVSRLDSLESVVSEFPGGAGEGTARDPRRGA